ncbi:type II secretion system protein N [Kangiella shandongensis]|uniref:type II secretion system protein N n=1 Tax=Kangiella shandongensis TaxID=2763258 RepID=UPI001CBCEDAD|nr:type II secretion system protein N [Kangiella shandongensis]
MKKIIIGAALALILFLLIFVYIAPAKTITGMVTDRVPGLQLINVEGSLWSTQVGRLNFRQLSLQNIQLDTHLLSLLVGTLSSSITVTDPNIQFSSDVELEEGRYRIENGQYRVDTAYVTSLMNLPVEGVSGAVEGFIKQFEMSEQSLLSLEAEGQWRDAVIQYTNNELTIGTLHFQLSKVNERENTARIEIIENQGVLDLKGTIEVSLDKRFNVKLHTTTDLPQHLKTWVSRWGRTEGERVYLEWQGRLP